VVTVTLRYSIKQLIPMNNIQLAVAWRGRSPAHEEDEATAERTYLWLGLYPNVPDTWTHNFNARSVILSLRPPTGILLAEGLAVMCRADY